MGKNYIKKKSRQRRQASVGIRQTSFLPEPDFNPKLPDKNTLAYHALCLLLQGKRISHLDFQKDTASWRLAAHIYILNRMGWPIETEDFIYYTRIKPRQRYVCQYFLQEGVIEKFKKISGGGLC